MSPPAIRTPEVPSRSERIPARSSPASGSSTHSTSVPPAGARSPAARRRDRAALDVARHPPRLVEIDEDLEGVADRLANRRDDRHALRSIPVAGDPDLDGTKTPLDERLGVLRPLLRESQRPPRGVGRQRLAGAAEQARHGLTARLPDQVPQRCFERPVTGRRRTRSSRACGRAADRPRIGADEEVSELLESGHRVPPLPIRDHPGVGLDADDRRVERPPRHRVPRGVEGRIQRQPQPVSSISTILSASP